MILPGFHAASAMLIALAMFYGFFNGKLRVEIVSLLTIAAIALLLYVMPMPGETKYAGLELAFQGFGHYALVTICALMIMGRGLVVTGALDPAARALARVWQFNKSLGLLFTLVVCLFMSMLINDTPVLVLMIPILAQMATRGGMPASKTLMPVNAAILIGGMSTTIGTSTNLLVVSIAQDLGMRTLSVFHFTPIVLISVLVALPYLWLVMPRLLPDNTKQVSVESRRFLAKLRLSDDAPMRGKTIEEARGNLPEDVRAWLPPGNRSHVGRRLLAEGTYKGLQEAARTLSATLAPRWLTERIKADSTRSREDLMVAEMILAPDCRLIGLTPSTAGFEGVAMLGIHHVHQPLRDTRAHTPDTAMAEGDVLLMMGMPEDLRAFAQAEGLLQIEGGEEITRSGKALLAVAIMLGSVGLASFGLVPIAISALAGAILMFVTGCVRFERVGRALSAKIIVLVASSIALGRFILVSGAAEWLGQILSSGLQYLPPAGVLAAIMVFVTLMTNFASNTAAAAVGTPIAFNIAKQLGMPEEPLVLAVLFGCNLCYATPVAYQTNMMILTEGDYTFKDYLRSGVPLVLIMVAALSTTLVFWYGI
ncbi:MULTISPECIES: SLC13 family permease [Novosphingobium]|uniref:Anion permease n=1 Tax=Novosphingobium decolorationis TaxID=2698673 RepID=A0ABX8E2T0_9SPHN|nr:MULTISPECIES: SLC13 family permease [Novosphingobium]MED5547467.1 SLC13 family permease [Pseudomonadota bacterium]QVM83228.1 anion permease [Novosphingobium decolorationis]GAM05954.1 transporter [Novosphingobium sp. MBES04]